MSYASFESLALLVVIAASAIHCVRTLAPATWLDWKKRALIVALQPGRPGWLRHFARRFAPPPRVPVAACGTCTGCEKGQSR